MQTLPTLQLIKLQIADKFSKLLQMDCVSRWFLITLECHRQHLTLDLFFQVWCHLFIGPLFIYLQLSYLSLMYTSVTSRRTGYEDTILLDVFYSFTEDHRWVNFKLSELSNVHQARNSLSNEWFINPCDPYVFYSTNL